MLKVCPKNPKNKNLRIRFLMIMKKFNSFKKLLIYLIFQKTAKMDYYKNFNKNLKSKTQNV